MITFGHRGVVTQQLGDSSPFVPAALFSPPRLDAGGVTPMLAAISEAIKLSEERKAHLRKKNVHASALFIFLLTDAAPTDSHGNLLPEEALRPTAQEIAALEIGKKLAFFAVGVRGADISQAEIARTGRDVGPGRREFLGVPAADVHERGTG